MKKILLLILLLGMLVSCAEEEEHLTLPEETAAETEELLPETEPVPAGELPVLVSLGDSIARGFGLDNPSEEAYIAVVAEELPATAYNFGVDGQDSTELVAYITNHAAIPAALADADSVTVSIGANNFLGDAFTFLGAYNDFKTNPSTTHTTDSVTEAFRQFNADVTEGVEQLCDDIPAILSAIRGINADCAVYFLTCYNPYGAVNVTLDWGNVMPVEFDTLADTCVSRLNEVITELSDEQGYAVADVYAAFDGKAARLVNAAPVESGDTFDGNAIDPHPNRNGHNVIAEVLTGFLG